MKNIIYFLVIIFTCSLVNAQDITFGLKAGASYGKIKSSESAENDHNNPVLGPVFGVVADIPIDEKFSVQPELLYFPAGYFFDYSTEGFTSEYKGKLNYLSIPIMGKYDVKDGFYLEAGPYISYLLSATEDEESDFMEEYLIKSSKSVDKTDDFKSIDFGLGIGAGYEMESGLYFNARYIFGLADINNQEMIEYKYYHSSQVNNYFFMMTIGYFWYSLFAVKAKQLPKN